MSDSLSKKEPIRGISFDNDMEVVYWIGEERKVTSIIELIKEEYAKKES